MSSRNIPNKWNNTGPSASRKRPLNRSNYVNSNTKRFCSSVPVTPRRPGIANRNRPKTSLAPRPNHNHVSSTTSGTSSGPGTTALSALESANVQRGNINVVVRVRPPMGREKGPARRIVVQAVDDQLIVFDPPEVQNDFFYHGVRQNCGNVLKKPNRDKKFAFDRVYGPHQSNAEIFEGTIKPIIGTLLEGYNCSVFAYGATGSGKTFTMLGNQENPGLTYLTVKEVYDQLKELQNDYKTEISISYLEVYNETIRDLLSTISNGDNSENLILDIRENGKGVTVSNLSTHRPKTPEELLSMLSFGNARRSQHPTDHNAESSRSHAVFQVHINLTHHHKNLQNSFRSSKLVMVDLAGSERGSATGFVGQRFREGAAINKSLLALANCINGLADGKTHIPFRDSKLTRILKDALGGKCKTVMIANVGPSDISYEDSFNTLKYANRAKNIRFQIKQNTLTVSARIAEYGHIVEEMNQKIETLTKALAEKVSKCTCSRPCTDSSTGLTEHNLSFAGNFFDETDGCSNETNSQPTPSNLTMTLYEQTVTFDKTYVKDEDDELLEQRDEVRRVLLETELEETKLRMKYEQKSTRLEAALAINPIDVIGAKGLERMKRTTESLKSRAALLKQRKEIYSNNLEEKENLLIPNPNEKKRRIRLNAMEYRKLKSDLELSKLRERGLEEQNLALQKDLLRAETLLGRSIKVLKPSFQVMRHLQYSNETIDQEYDGIINEYLESRITWAGGDSIVQHSSGNNGNETMDL